MSDNLEDSLNYLDSLNAELAVTLEQIDTLPAEDDSVDLLVSKLQVLVAQRQDFINKLVVGEKMVDRQYLEKQLSLTQSFLKNAEKAMLHRRDLLVLGKQSRRQINVYKNVDSNR